MGYTTGGNSTDNLGAADWRCRTLETSGDIPPQSRNIRPILSNGEGKQAILVLGGRAPDDFSSDRVATTPMPGWILDLESRVWQKLPKFKGERFPFGLYSHTATSISPTTLIVLGGKSALGLDSILHYLDLEERAVKHLNRSLVPLNPHHAFFSTVNWPTPAGDNQKTKSKPRRKRGGKKSSEPKPGFLYAHVYAQPTLGQLDLRTEKWSQKPTDGVKVVLPFSNFGHAGVPSNGEVDFVVLNGGIAALATLEPDGRLMGHPTTGQCTTADHRHIVLLFEDRHVVSFLSIQHPWGVIRGWFLC